MYGDSFFSCGFLKQQKTANWDWKYGDYLQNLVVERMDGPASSPELNPFKLWDQFEGAARVRLTNKPSWLNYKKCWLKNVMSSHSSM